MTTPTLYPSLSILLWLMATLVLVVLPHFSRVIWWVPLIFSILLLWRYLITRYHWRLPGSWIQFSIAILLLVGIFVSYRTLLGRDAGVALLVALCGLKLLEMTNQRDALLVCFLGYFLIITNFLYSQTIPMALYMSVVILVTTATLISISDLNHRVPVAQRLRLSGTLLIQSVPLMIALFVLFPRISGTFWALPKDAHSSTSGLSESMSPGNISDLSLSDEIVFRVKFTGDPPPPAHRYWRGPVLWWSNGFDWKTKFQSSFIIPQETSLQPAGKPYDYTITLEPHNQRWLFALDLPSQVPLHSRMTTAYQILANTPIQQRMRYELRSYTQYRADLFTPQFYNDALRLPTDKHPRARALAEQWRQELSQPEAISQRALRYFNQEPFRYTYTPPLLENDLVDEFLFETRQGFCEHYAAAFTVLMRAAGIPTRIVTGYLGGTLNSIDGYLVVRQRDAHAWAEVWLGEKGWVRIDPTSAVAPERIETGVGMARPTVFSPLGLMWQNDSVIVQLWQQLRDSWDALNNGWNQWILGYDTARQRLFLSRLGLGNLDWQGMITTLVIIAAGLLLLTAAWVFLCSKSVARHDPVQQSYLRFCQKLARHGLLRSPSEGPLTFATRVSVARPDLAESVQRIVDLYVEIRYRGQFEALPQLRLAVKLFS
jgi:transglutaminase-like putative cysteine protease